MMIGRQQMMLPIRKSLQQMCSPKVINRFVSISSQSWAAEPLGKKGLSIQEIPKEKFSMITSEVLNQRSDKVDVLANEILSLNSLESMALWKSLQVRMLLLSVFW